MIVDPKPIPYLYDQADNFVGGIDTSKAPDLIQEGYSSFAVNTTFRGGKPQSRPAFEEFIIPEQENLEWFRYKKHQGDTLYQDTNSDLSYMISVRGGKVFKFNFDDLSITHLEIDLNDTTRRHYFQQVDKFLVIQNGVDIPLIYDGVTIRRARTQNTPTGDPIPNTSISTVGTTATVTTSSQHGLTAGNYVTITDITTEDKYLGQHKILTTPTTTTYTFSVTAGATNIISPAAGNSYYTTSNRNPNKNVSITNTTGVAVVTTSESHGLSVGDFITISAPISQTGYIGNYRVEKILSPTQYQIAVNYELDDETDPTSAGITYRVKEVPIGLYMEYSMNRLCVVSPDRKTVRIGDLIRQTPDTAAVDSVLWFTDEDFLAESYVFSLPTSQGRIRAIKVIPDLDNAQGQGSIFISGNKGISTLSLAYPRTEWISRPIQKISMTGVGCASQTGIVGYNGDLLFRDIEYGIRSFRLAGARFTKAPIQTPMSSEMNRLFLDDDVDKLQYTSMEVFDNRLLCTVTPVANYRRVRVTKVESIGNESTITLFDDVPFQVGDKLSTERTTLDSVDHGEFTVTAVPASNKVTVTGTNGATQDTSGGVVYSSRTGAEYYHRGIAVLDYTTISGAGGETYPAWDGLWTGLNVQSILKAEIGNKPRCIVTHYNELLDRNEVWEITRNSGADLYEGFDPESPIYPDSFVELKSMDCDKTFSLKRFLGLDLFLSDMRSRVQTWVYYRSDGDPCWWDWTFRGESTSATAEACAIVNQDQVSETSQFSKDLVQSRPQGRLIKLGQPYITCKSTTAQDGRLFYETQLKIKWNGIVTWDKIRLMALEQIEDMRGRCY